MKNISLAAFSDRMNELFPRLVRGIARQGDNYLTKGVITLPQFWTLNFLLKRKDCPMRELADSMHLGFSSMTGLVDRLAKQGLVERRRTEKDRRVVFVNISGKGRKVLCEIFDQRRKMIMSLFGNLTARERFEYLYILEKLVGKLSENRK